MSDSGDAITAVDMAALFFAAGRLLLCGGGYVYKCARGHLEICSGMLFNGAWEAAVDVSFLVTVPVDSDHKSGTFDGLQARPLGLHHLRRHSADEYGEDGRRQELWMYPLVLCCLRCAFPFVFVSLALCCLRAHEKSSTFLYLTYRLCLFLYVYLFSVCISCFLLRSYHTKYYIHNLRISREHKHRLLELWRGIPTSSGMRLTRTSSWCSLCAQRVPGYIVEVLPKPICWRLRQFVMFTMFHFLFVAQVVDVSTHIKFELDLGRGLVTPFFMDVHDVTFLDSTLLCMFCGVSGLGWPTDNLLTTFFLVLMSGIIGPRLCFFLTCIVIGFF